jgi:hypothetical protein
MNDHRQLSGFRKIHPCKLCLFAVLSVADLFMTWQLLQASDGQIYESNPLADAWLAMFGWAGLAIFKSLAMMLVALSAVYVSFHRPKAAGRILVFACIVTGAVVAYSCFLSIRDAHASVEHAQDACIAEHKGLLLDQEMHRQRSYHALLGKVGQDLMAHRCSLDEAVQQLASSEKARSHSWLRMLHKNYPGRSDAECLALHIGYHTLALVDNSPEVMKQLCQQLEADYRTTYGRDAQFNLPVSSVSESADGVWPDPTSKVTSPIDVGRCPLPLIHG